MIEGTYTLKLTCLNAGTVEPGRYADNSGHAPDEFPHTFTEKTLRIAHRVAKKRGWVIDGNVAICPMCAHKLGLS